MSGILHCPVFKSYEDLSLVFGDQCVGGGLVDEVGGGENGTDDGKH